MFLRSFLQRKTKRDNDDGHSSNKGDTNAGKTNNRREPVKKSKNNSLPKEGTNKAPRVIYSEAGQSPSSSSNQPRSDTETTRSPSIPSSPAQRHPDNTQDQTAAASSSREQTLPSKETSKSFVGQQGDGSVEEYVDACSLQSAADTEGNPRNSVGGSNGEDEELSASESQIDELIQEVLNTVSKELATEQLSVTSTTEQINPTKVGFAENVRDTSAEGNNQCNGFIKTRSESGQFNYSRKENETCSSRGSDRQLIGLSKIKESHETFKLSVSINQETSKQTSSLENHRRIEEDVSDRRGDGSKSNVSDEDSTATYKDISAINVPQIIISQPSGSQVNASPSLEYEPPSNDSPDSINQLVAKEFLQMVISDVCAGRTNSAGVTPKTDAEVTTADVNCKEVNEEVKVQPEDDQSMYYTTENLDCSLDAPPHNCGPRTPPGKEEQYAKGKHRLNVLACKFESVNTSATKNVAGTSAKAEEEEYFHDVIPFPFANSTPVKWTGSTNGHQVSQTYSEEYLSPKSSFINEVSFGGIANHNWSQMDAVEEFDEYRKENVSCDVFDVSHPHTLDDFVITPCEDSDTEDGEEASGEELTKETKTVQTCGNDDHYSVGEDVDFPDDQVAVASPDSQDPVRAQSKEEKMTDLNSWKEYRRTSMLRAIITLRDMVSEKQESTFGKLKASIEQFVEKTSSIAEREGISEVTEREDEGEIVVLDRRLQSILDHQASLAFSLKNTEERTKLMEAQLEQWEVAEEDRKQQIICLREEVESATARQRSLAVMLNDECRLKEALQLRLATLTQEKQQLLYKNVMLWEQTSQIELKQEHFQSVSEKEKSDLEEQLKALESELLALRSLKTGEPVKKISSESACSACSDNIPTGACTPKQSDDTVLNSADGADFKSSRRVVPYDHHRHPPHNSHHSYEVQEGEFCGPVPYPHYRGNHRPNHNNSGFPFPPPRYPPRTFARGSRFRRRGEHQQSVHFDRQPLPWYPNNREDFRGDRGRGQRPFRGRGFRGRGSRGRGNGRGRRGRFQGENQA